MVPGYGSTAGGTVNSRTGGSSSSRGAADGRQSSGAVQPRGRHPGTVPAGGRHGRHVPARPAGRTSRPRTSGRAGRRWLPDLDLRRRRGPRREGAPLVGPDDRARPPGSGSTGSAEVWLEAVPGGTVAHLYVPPGPAAASPGAASPGRRGARRARRLPDRLRRTWKRGLHAVEGQPGGGPVDVSEPAAPSATTGGAPVCGARVVPGQQWCSLCLQPLARGRGAGRRHPVRCRTRSRGRTRSRRAGRRTALGPRPAGRRAPGARPRCVPARAAGCRRAGRGDARRARGHARPRSGPLARGPLAGARPRDQAGPGLRRGRRPGRGAAARAHPARPAALSSGARPPRRRRR